MIRLSFRQSLLLGFLVMVALLAWSALESWLVLEQLTVRLQRTNARALELREAVQSLAERTVDLERGARQYLILSDPAVLDHFERNASAALASLGRVENIPGGGFQELTDSWRQELTRLSSSVREGKGSDDLAASLSRLAQINSSLARDSRHWIDTQHTVWSDALEERRRDLTRLLVAGPVQRGEHAAGELVGLLEDRVHQIGGNLLVTGQLHDFVETGEFTHHELHVADGGVVLTHCWRSGKG